jgi:hypothetical protein
MAIKDTPPYTWRGVLEHLAGVQNFSGQNGLATYVAAKPSFDAGVLEIGWRERNYGGRSTGISTSVSGKIPTPIPGVDGSVGVKVGGIEVNGALKGKFSLLDVFKRARQLAEKAQQLGPLKRFIDGIISRLPNIEISGEVALYLGLSSKNIPYLRLQTGAGVAFNFKIGPMKDTKIKGVSGGIGRSWQIQLNNWQAHVPGLHQFNY